MLATSEPQNMALYWRVGDALHVCAPAKARCDILHSIKINTQAFAYTYSLTYVYYQYQLESAGCEFHLR